MAGIADLAEHSRTRPVPEPGNRGTGPGTGPGGGQGLEEALGTAIAARVREFRLQLGWTVGQLAAQSGLSKGMLSKIENAQASPSLATLARLSEALQVPVTAFFRGLNEEQDVMFVKAGRGLNIEHKGSGSVIATNRSASCARPATPSSRCGSRSPSGATPSRSTSTPAPS